MNSLTCKYMKSNQQKIAGTLNLKDFDIFRAISMLKKRLENEADPKNADVIQKQ